MNNGWTAERRARQSALIRTWKPWEQSTGPRTDEGKVIASLNRQRALDAARQDIAEARRKLIDAQSRLESLGVKPGWNIAGALAMLKSF